MTKCYTLHGTSLRFQRQAHEKHPYEMMKHDREGSDREVARVPMRHDRELRTRWLGFGCRDRVRHMATTLKRVRVEP